jgi:hypothetical protein
VTPSALADRSVVAPAYHSAPAYSRTLGPEVTDLCTMVGYEPDPEQRLILDDAFGIGPDGKSAAFEVGVVCSRQNLKTGSFKQMVLGWLFISEVPLIVWSAHEFDTAKEAHRDLAMLIDGSDVLRKRVKRIYFGNGSESIELQVAASACCSRPGPRPAGVASPATASCWTRRSRCTRTTWARWCPRWPCGRTRSWSTDPPPAWRTATCCGASATVVGRACPLAWPTSSGARRRAAAWTRPAGTRSAWPAACWTTPVAGGRPTRCSVARGPTAPA